MDETEWLKGTDPKAMLEFLQGKVSDRKLRRFACACCQHSPTFLENLHQSQREKIEAAERWADEPGAHDWAALRVGVYVQGVMWTTEDTALVAAQWWAEGGSTTFRMMMPDLLRDIVGNPFRPTSLDPTWLAWNEGLAVTMAMGIADDLAFDRMPILADALEEAGCDGQAILEHLRGPGPHVRGCHILDALMGKT